MVLSRRDFFKLALGCGAGLGLGSLGLRDLPYSKIQPSTSASSGLQEARFYRVLAGGKVRCELCFRHCIILQGARGLCGNRVNIDGRLYTLVYGRPCAVQVDPVEKEPQFHMLPGSQILCIGTAGCNFKCVFCHNWEISTRTVEETGYVDLPPEKAVESALGSRVAAVSFTYNEPTVFYEYMYDTAKLAREKGLKTILHTNASMNKEPLNRLLEHVDAVTVDLKAFTADFYRSTSFSDLTPVLETLKTIQSEGVWMEIVNLIIPTFNDDMDSIRDMCIWIRDNLGVEVPLHFNRFFPAYKLTNLPPTPVKTLEEARDIAFKTGIEYVTIGNVPGHEANSTRCPRCRKILIKRTHFTVHEINIVEGRCRFCNHKIPGIWR
ncbi:MAG: AmmeMemoRadiSam system radical SAM enzyme, partial [Candidatus Bathyarchaeia archaeon]